MASHTTTHEVVVGTLDVAGLQALLDALGASGRTVVGPTERAGVITYEALTSVDDLPRGVGEDQDAGTYRLRARGDGAVFGFATTGQSWKRWLFPSRQLLWRGERREGGFSVDAPTDHPEPVALLGVRGCDLAAIAALDRVLVEQWEGRPASDPHYAARRASAFLVAVACSTPGGTCFCASMGTGPRPGPGADLVLTELAPGTPDHRFLVATGSAAGEDFVAQAGLPLADVHDADRDGAAAQAADATAAMGRSLDTDGLGDLLIARADDNHWDDIGERCLTCTGCTLVCPTCFCTAVEDVTDLSGDRWDRWRVWDSCFTPGFSYIHGGSVRESSGSRYRQWMTHKLGTWREQFDASGCVGCGRCITWCPVGIDITEEAADLRSSDASRTRRAGRRGDRDTAQGGQA
jgi:ferredoxin